MPPQQNQVPPVTPQYVSPVQSVSASNQPHETLAILALIFGIVGLIPWVGTLFAIAAVIIGSIGLSHIKKGTAGGHGMALAGTILGGVGLVITALIASFIFTTVLGLFHIASKSFNSVPQFPTTYTTPTTYTPPAVQ